MFISKYLKKLIILLSSSTLNLEQIQRRIGGDFRLAPRIDKPPEV